MRIEEIKKYISDDGLEFETEEECEMHEQNTKDAKYMLGDIPWAMVDYEDFYGNSSGSNTCYYLILRFENRDQVDRFDMWLWANGDKLRHEADSLVGETVFVDVYTGCECGELADIDSVYGYYTEAEMITRAVKRIVNFAKEVSV